MENIKVSTGKSPELKTNRYPFGTMPVGGWFQMSRADAEKVRTSASQYRRRHHGKRFRVNVTADGLSVVCKRVE